MLQNNKSQEAYFGKEYGSLGSIIEKHVTNIRELYIQIDSNDYKTVAKNAKMYREEIGNEMKIGRASCRERV